MNDLERKQFKKLKKRVCKLEKQVDSLLIPEVVIAPGIVAFQMSTLKENYYDFYQPHSNTHVAVDRTVYHNGAGIYPTFGDFIYSDPAGTIPIDGAVGNEVNFYLGDVDPLGNGVDEYFIQIGPDGGFSFLETAAGFDSNG